MKKHLPTLQSMAEKAGIEVEKTVKTKTITGWFGRGKGLEQILWERGMIDATRRKEYLKKKLDDRGKLVKEFSLTYMMGSCPDFQNEVCQLAHIGNELGVRVIITTKYHAEYAGEGIEYSWGFSKSYYRRQPLVKKKGKEKFLELFTYCISRELITKDMVRKFSKRARSYMVAYRALESDEMKDGDMPADITHKMIEKMRKIVSSHRAALDFDAGYLSKILKEEGLDVVAVVKSEKKTVPKKRKPESESSDGKKARSARSLPHINPTKY